MKFLHFFSNLKYKFMKWCMCVCMFVYACVFMQVKILLWNLGVIKRCFSDIKYPT